MKIQINNQDVDFLIEQENSLEDIVEVMLDWCANRGLVLYTCFADEIEFLPEEIPDLLTEDIKVLNFDVKSQAEVLTGSFIQANLYCNKLIDLAKEKLENEELSDLLDGSTLSDVENGLGWIADLLDSTAGILFLDLEKPIYKTFSLSDIISTIENYRGKYSSLSEAGALKEAVEIAHEAQEFLSILAMSSEMNDFLIKSMDSPDMLLSTLFEIKNSFPNTLDNIEQIAILFQSGKDGEAIEKLNEFTEFVYAFMKICAQFPPIFDVSLKDVIKDDISLEEKNEELKDKLFEMATAMENNDMIGLADILEYEIKPLVEDMESYIDILMSKVETTH